MSYKKRTAAEVEEILRDFAGGKSIPELCQQYSISQTSFYRILSGSRGVDVSKTRENESKIKKLEKIIAQRDLEISLMKAALKKS